MRTALVALAALFFASPAHADSSLDEVAKAHRKLLTAPAAQHDDAQFALAQSLDKAKLTRIAVSFLAEIAERPQHVHHRDALAMLVRLAGEVPDPDLVIERIGRYDDDAIDDADRKSGGAASYWAARYRYANHDYATAKARFARVPATSSRYAESQYRAGIADVQLRDAKSAIAAFDRATTTDDDALKGLAELALARTYYSTAFRSDGTVDASRLDVAIRHWEAVDPASSERTAAESEMAWAHFARGDHQRALGLIHVAESPYLAPYYPQPEITLLHGEILLANCRYRDVETIAARFQTTYEPVANELRRRSASFEGDAESAYRFLRSVRDGKADVSRRALPLVELALSDRAIFRRLAAVTQTDLENARMRLGFAAYEGRRDLVDSGQLGHDIAVSTAADLARERLRALAESLDAQMKDAEQLLDAGQAGTRGELDESSIPLRTPARDAARNVVHGDDEHVAWPFTGEIWKDEVGSYRGSVRSQCRR